MFSGIVQELGTVVEMKTQGAFASLVVEGVSTAAKMKIGDSVSVSGVCLTAVKLKGAHIATQVVFETLKRSALGALRKGNRVNLELSLSYGDFVGGHLVQGHVDAAAKIVSKVQKKNSVLMGFKMPKNSVKYMVEKGSVAVDGISLTVVGVKNDVFTVALIPHTLENTTLGLKKTGERVNIETDVLAKYMENFLKNYFRKGRQ